MVSIIFLIIILSGLIIIFIKKIQNDYYYEYKKYKYLPNKKISIINNNNNEYHVYNASIYWKDDNKEDFLVIARISDNKMENIKDKCNYYNKIVKKNLNIKDYKKYFDIFDPKIPRSGIVDFVVNIKNKNNNIYGQIVNPFFTTENSNSNFSEGFEDPRIFKFRNKLWIICHFRGINFPYPSLVNTNNFNNNNILIFPIDNSSKPILLYYKNMKKWEKNWMPFEYNNNLYIIYSINPSHKILLVDINTGKCTDIYETKSRIPSREFGNGSPPQLIKIFNKEYLLCIAHIRGLYKNNNNITRKNIFYLFNKDPPFNIKYISNIFNLDSTFYEIEFAVGLMVDQNKKLVYISYGIDDCYNIITSIKIDDIEKILYKV
jgi:predicted GH43/DUF377 family glycosyl hydrolase